jgi:hypothetical protein
MDMIKKQPILFIVLAFIAGWIIGLTVFGWYLFPVEWTEAGPRDLGEEDQDRYLLALAELYVREGNPVRVNEAIGSWDGAYAAICQLATEPAGLGAAAQLNQLAAAVNNGVPCGGTGAVPPAEDDEGGGGPTNIIVICGLGLLLLLVVGGLLFLMQQRGGGSGKAHAPVEMPTSAPIMEEGMGGSQQVTPIARFQTMYARGHDTYDDSFSIENADGDFLGECGVGLSETIGADTPKNVSAFEVWLFDKNDIRTVTKVIMSDHAFFDEAIKAKLAPKGEPVLARPGETIVLETASLIVNAEITEMEYGTGTLPPQSFFERFTVELSAWAKDGDYGEPDVQGRIDELLEF